jgi:PAS domain S-box-containing protein
MVGEIRANKNDLSAEISDSEFRQLADNIPTLCWIADAEGYIVWYNRRWYEYTGMTPSSMGGWGWQSVHDLKSLPDVLERWTAAISAAQPFEMVFPIRGADGVFRPFLTRINPAFDEHGTVIKWFGVNTDISPQIEAEEGRIRSENRFRVLADSMPQMVWSSRPDGHHDYFNARWYEFLRVPIGSTDGETWIAAVHPDDRVRVLSGWTQALETGDPYYTEYRLRHHSGEYRWVLVRAYAERDERDIITRWYGTSTDIEAIVEARSTLQRSKDNLELEIAARTYERDLFATIVETTNVMIMAIDLDFNILAVNKANVRAFERSCGVAVRAGDNLLAMLTPDQQLAAKTAWSQVLNGEEVSTFEDSSNETNARSYYEIKYRVLRDDKGLQIGAFQFRYDVTERVQAQAKLAEAHEALLQSQKLEAIGQLTGGVAHDFNNLLTPITGSLDMLRRRGIGNERERRLIDGAYQSAERAKNLVHRLLAFARRQPLQSKSTDIAALVRGLAELIASSMNPQIKLLINIADSLPPAKSDPQQLEMAILNLCMNARDAIQGSGTLTISVANENVQAEQMPSLKPGNYIRLSVADTGKGMDEATIAKAVEPFFSTKGIGQGTGLGLSMAHGLASQLEGALTIQSRLGNGTEVSIWLPASEEPICPRDEYQDFYAAPMNAGAVLLVDDEECIRMSTSSMLTELGFEVHEVPSAEKALHFINSGIKIDILITDHLMPGMTGVELARAVRAVDPSIKILIISGFAEAEGIDPSLSRLHKPFVLSELVSALSALR